jgi:two-component system, chemotaxis family, protein-glutamate methylesterase/glutaminase
MSEVFPSSRKIKVLVVDDSVVIRKLLRSVIDAEPDMEVVNTAADGSIALKKLDQTPPDLITMDLDMPEMDGLQAVRAIRARGLKIPVIMVSAATYAGADKTLDCLKAGADDFILKPANLESFASCLENLRGDLLPKIRVLVPAVQEHPRSPLAPAIPIRSHQAIPASRGKVAALVVGSSTGGPAALDQFFGCLGGNLGIPVLVVQHMPAFFTKNLADRMDANHVLSFREGSAGDWVDPNHVYIAPGGYHMEVVRSGARVKIATQQGPMENYCRPAVDVLFRSAVNVYGGNLIAVVLTGMGRDGCSGAGLIREAGGMILAQDEASSVVWGMPGAVASAGFAHEILPIPDIVARVHARIHK